MPVLSAPVHAAWQRYESDAFSIVSDLQTAEVNKIANALVALERATAELPGLGNAADPDRYPPVQMLLFARRRDFNRIIDRPVFAAFTQPGLMETLLVAGPTRGRTSVLHNALHEYTHYLLRKQPHSHPPWYEEGIATLLGHSEFNFQADQAEVTLRLPRNPDFERTAVRELLDTRAYVDLPRRKLISFYHSSAELVNFLLFARSESLPDYRTSLPAYLHERDFDAWSQSAFSLNDLSRQAHAFERRRREISQRIQVSHQPLRLTALAITDDETQRLMARAAEVARPPRAAALYRELLEKAPRDAQLHAGLIRSLAEVDLEQARQALAAAQTLLKEDPLLQVSQASILTRQCVLQADVDCRGQWRDASALLRQALRQRPDLLDAIFLLGVAELYSGHPGRAVNYLRAAHQRVPWSPLVNFYLGECQRLLGASNARRYLDNARDWALQPYVRKLAAAALEKLAEPGDTTIDNAETSP